jgi:hypothetical protein
MAALNMFEAAKISRNPLTRGIMLGLATTNELFGIFPWVQKVGNAWQYDREKALPTVEFVSPTHTAITESSGTFDQVTAQMRLIASDVDVYNHTQNQNDPNGDPRAVQLGMKLKALGMSLQTKMFTGSYVTSFTVSNAAVTPGLAVDAAVPSAHTDSDRLGPGSLRYTHTGTFWAYRAPGDRTYGPNVAAASDGTYTLVSDNPNKKLLVTLDVSDATADGECMISFTSTTHEIDGVNKLIPSGQIVASSGANGDALSFDVMDRLLYEKVKVRSDLYFVMNAALKRKFMALVRSSSGGMTPEQLSLPILGMDGQPAVMRVPQYNGIPILQVDDIPSNEAKGGASTLSSLYLVSLTPEVGLYGGVQAVGREVMADLDPRRARIMGVRLYEFPQLEGKAAQRTRVEWFGAIALGSELAAARASELVTA